MVDRLTEMLAGAAAQYADIRYETLHKTTISFGGRDLTELVSCTTDGFVVRVLDGGGMSSVAFTRPEDAPEALRTATINARLIGSRMREPVALAPADPTVADVRPQLDEHPNAVTLEEKLAMVREYNDIPLSHERIATTDLNYADVVRQKAFVSTEGARVAEELVTVRVNGTIVAEDGGLTQTVRVQFGGSDGFGRVRHRHDLVEARTAVALDLLKAEPVEAGTYGVVLDQSLAGVFAHEAFGHFSEADLIQDAPSMRERMQLGTKLGVEALAIVDDATAERQLGHYVYDDEGVAVRCTPLMQDGVLVGRLHSRRTAAAFGEPISGHCVAEDYRYGPLVRMGSIYIEPRNATLDDLLGELGDGIYALSPMGGQTSGESFTFGAQYGYLVRGGRRRQMLRDLNLSGNLYRTLESIRGIAGDLKLSETGGCGKGQLNIRSCNGGPHLLVDGIVIGGR
jgi:TldD protein